MGTLEEVNIPGDKLGKEKRRLGGNGYPINEGHRVEAGSL